MKNSQKFFEQFGKVTKLMKKKKNRRYFDGELKKGSGSVDVEEILAKRKQKKI